MHFRLLETKVAIGRHVFLPFFKFYFALCRSRPKSSTQLRDSQAPPVIPDLYGKLGLISTRRASPPQPPSESFSCFIFTFFQTT